MSKQNLHIIVLSRSIYKWHGGHYDMVINNKETLKFLKRNLQFTSQVLQIKPCGHHGRFLNKKQFFFLEDVILMNTIYKYQTYMIGLNPN
jgi:spore cortex formation protein SpoVR/YcgB (stage V sporulation)